MSERQKSPVPLFDPNRLHAALDRLDLAAIVGHSRRNFYYLSGFPSFDYVIEPEAVNFVVVPRDSQKPPSVTIPMADFFVLQAVPLWVPQKIYCGQFYIGNGPALDGLSAPTTLDGLLLALREAGLGEMRVGFELEQLPVTIHRKILEEFPKMQIVDASPLLRQLRMIKSEEEIRRIRHACEITEEAINDAVAELYAGMTEKELGYTISEGIVSRGAEVLYIMIGTSGAAGLGPPTERPIQVGDVIRADIAAHYEQYHSDLGRSFVVGEPTPQQSELYRTACRAVQTGIDAAVSGATAESIFAKAMAVWSEAGYPQIRRHHVGHGIGLQAHEAPMLKPGIQAPIQPGMVLAIEVPYYVHGLGGFAPEDVLVVGSEGNIRFTHAAAELPVIGV